MAVAGDSRRLHKKFMHNFTRRSTPGPLALWAAAIALLIAGCAAEVVREPALLQAASPRATIELQRLATIALATGYERSLLTGSRWQHAGELRQGQVFRPVGTVFTIEGANTHEAFLVLRDGRLVGFYLPGERAFSALEPAVGLDFKTVDPGR